MNMSGVRKQIEEISDNALIIKVCDEPDEFRKQFQILVLLRREYTRQLQEGLNNEPMRRELLALQAQLADMIEGVV